MRTINQSGSQVHYLIQIDSLPNIGMDFGQIDTTLTLTSSASNWFRHGQTRDCQLSPRLDDWMKGGRIPTKSKVNYLHLLDVNLSFKYKHRR